MASLSWSQKIAATVIIALVVVGGYGVVQSFSREQKAMDQAKNNQDNATEKAIGAVENIRNQKIVSTDGGKISLKNGQTLDIVDNSRNDCQVGDIIRDYNSTTENFSCERVNSSGVSTFHPYFYPYIGSPFWNTGRYTPNTNFHNGVSYLNNNGYNYDSAAKSYSSPNGSKFDIGPANGKSPTIKNSGGSGGIGGDGTGHGGVKGGSTTGGG